MTNPYLGYGKPVSGERLVGRERELRELTEYLSSTASLSIIGQRRIGKTSLVIEVIKQTKSNNCILIDLSVYPTAKDFFEAILEEIDDNIEELPEKFKSILLEEVLSDYDAYRKFRKLLKILNKNNITIKVVIDEFDAIKSLPNYDQVIKWLRELIDKGFETGVSAIFISRRSLYAIERQTENVSNLDGVCSSMYIKPLSEDALILMAKKCEYFFQIDNTIEKLKYYTGGYPYLAEMFLYRTWNTESLNKGISDFVNEVYDSYEHLRNLLSEDKLFDQMIQIVISPAWNLEVGSKEKLISYGLIKSEKIEDKLIYKAFSEHFQNYLEKCEREIPIWDKWSETEKALRSLIETKYEQKYGEDWLNHIASKNSAIQKLICDCQAKFDKDKRDFGLNISARLLDYTYPMNLWDLICWGWGDVFSPVFKDKKYWKERFELLNLVRNPYAHNRPYVVDENKLSLAQIYCKEIQELIKHQ